MDMQTVLVMIQDFTGHKWLPLSIVVVGYLTMLLGDTSKLPISIPDRWKPVLVIGLGQVYAILDKVQGGDSWKHAVWVGVMTAFGAMGLFDLLIKAAFDGKVPKWLQWLALIDPKLVEAKQTVGIVAPVLGRAHPSTAPPPPPPCVTGVEP